jgi:hypothetical protein
MTEPPSDDRRRREVQNYIMENRLLWTILDAEDSKPIKGYG